VLCSHTFSIYFAHTVEILLTQTVYIICSHTQYTVCSHSEHEFCSHSHCIYSAYTVIYTVIVYILLTQSFTQSMYIFCSYCFFSFHFTFIKIKILPPNYFYRLRFVLLLIKRNFQYRCATLVLVTILTPSSSWYFYFVQV
jgi:hypothetical protein